MREQTVKFLYFLYPVPSSAGFSPYRFPGMAVHLPAWFIFLCLGYYWCWAESWLRPVFIVFLVTGWYLARELAIYAHYGCLITPVVWLLALLFLTGVNSFSAADLREWLGTAYVPAALVLAALTLSVFAYDAWNFMKE
ncbi:MAG: hypothetical protein AB1641_01485 [Thermodesulfobacteriota bacterium]